MPSIDPPSLAKSELFTRTIFSTWQICEWIFSILLPSLLWLTWLTRNPHYSSYSYLILNSCCSYWCSSYNLHYYLLIIMNCFYSQSLISSASFPLCKCICADSPCCFCFTRKMYITSCGIHSFFLILNCEDFMTDEVFIFSLCLCTLFLLICFISMRVKFFCSFLLTVDC